VTPSAFFLSLALLLSFPASQPVQHFKKAPTSQFPREVVERDFCKDQEQDCWERFLRDGSLWAGDVNGDGAAEFLVFPGDGWQGSGGSWYYLYEKRGKDWVSLAKETNDQDFDGWFTLHPRFDILPAVRNGYHDLRVAAAVCMKWDGKEYVDYDPADYHSLDPGWFNSRDSNDAEIFWAIRYAGHDKIIFRPQWFPISQGDFPTRDQLERLNPLPEHYLGVELNDPKEHIRWYAVHKGGVWAVRGTQVFFLAPQVSEALEGVGDLKIDRDWLLGMGASRPSIRYNRRTHDLILDRHDYDDADSPDK